MDLTDLKIIKLLLRNSRMAYREIADGLEVTVNAIHKRIKKLCDLNVIRRFTATPNLANLEGKQVHINGVSKAKQVTELCSELGKHSSVFFIGITGGKHLIIDGELKKDDNINEYVSYIVEKAKLTNPFISVVNQFSGIYFEPFTKTDQLIIKSLQEDGRKSIIDITEETKLSAKTIRKSLNKFQEKNMVDFSILWAPDSEKDIIGNFEIYLKEGQSINDETHRLLDEYPNIVYFQTFKDKPRVIMLTTWFDASRKLQQTYEILDKYGYEEVILRVIYTGYFYETWRMNLFNQKK